MKRQSVVDLVEESDSECGNGDQGRQGGDLAPNRKSGTQPSAVTQGPEPSVRSGRYLGCGTRWT